MPLKYFKLVFLLFFTANLVKGQTHPFKPFSSANLQRNGSYVFVNLLQDLFTNKVDTTSVGVDGVFNTYTKNTALIIVNSEIKFSSEHRSKLLSYVRNGNVLFLAGLSFEEELQSLTSMTVPDYNIERLFDSTILKLDSEPMSPYKNYENYSMRSDFVNNYISKVPYNATILGHNNKYETNFIKIEYGDGIIFVHTAPFLFSNQFLLKDNNSSYVQSVLSHIPNNLSFIYYDEYIYNYRSNASNIKTSKSSGGGGSGGGNGQGGGGDEPPGKLDYILNDPNLKPAFYLSLLAIGLAALFAALRKQRPIHVVPPVQNNSKELVNTISDVYLNYLDNKIIADKKIKFFNETIRAKYGINNSTMDQDFWQKLFNKSGMDTNSFNQLQQAVVQCNNNNSINNKTLINLSNKLENFYKI
jgi:hypothetical protein